VRIEIIKFRIMYFSRFPVTLSLLGPNILLGTIFYRKWDIAITRINGLLHFICRLSFTCRLKHTHCSRHNILFAILRHWTKDRFS